MSIVKIDDFYWARDVPTNKLVLVCHGTVIATIVKRSGYDVECAKFIADACNYYVKNRFPDPNEIAKGMVEYIDVIRKYGA